MSASHERMSAHCKLALIHVKGPSTRSLFKIELANESTFNRVGLRSTSYGSGFSV